MTYMIECLSCKVKGVKKQYWGETHRTLGDRAADHVQALRDTNLDYGKVKHQVNDHPSQVPNFAYVDQKSWKTALERQVAKSLLIDEAENKSNEFNVMPQPMVRIVMVKPQVTVHIKVKIQAIVRRLTLSKWKVIQQREGEKQRTT